jgi:hypothetical protein
MIPNENLLKTKLYVLWEIKVEMIDTIILPHGGRSQ